jgi:hypothetical protein
MQEGMKQMLTEIYASKVNIGKIIFETEELMKEHITVHIVESISEKSTLVKDIVEEISGRFQELEK